MKLIGQKITYRRPFSLELLSSKVAGLTKTLDDQDILILENGDNIIKGPQIICPEIQQQPQQAC
ncbi:hypothetical protein [Desulfobulbus oligotrophicus]|uniref:Uncharacterized protein n=1 Tax=Desulfobulbus oligotrophicus TaxID=1909699 RepID=A0A7T5VEC7_9BACT|nr:hypothetical protein [Desulfobulbus oligotrophicus]QQG66334.1 hypothetical protein HP555_10885 [Desulfobulbus oligotrophicus]